MRVNLEQLHETLEHSQPTLMDNTGRYAVLVPLVEGEDGSLSVLYEVRAGTLRRQPGEVCFPGGRREPGETPWQTALRETWEELAVPSEEIQLLGPLDVIQDISDRVVYPFLARITPQGLAALQPSADEVKDVFFVPLDYLQNYPEEVYRYKVAAQVDDRFPYERMGFPKTYPWRTGFMDVPIYEYQGHFIWGMTARTVRWLLRQLQLMEEGTP